MYCTLEDAFPQDSRGVAPRRPNQCKPAASKVEKRASCWVKDEQPVVKSPAAVEEAPPKQVAAPSPHVNRENPCFSALHHCLSCATCQRMLELHHLSNEVVVGAQVGRPLGKRKSRRPPRMAAQVDPSLAFLNVPILKGSNITWGHLLIIMTAGAFLLLLVDRLKK